MVGHAAAAGSADVKAGNETPQTGTPPTRSVSPSSDGSGSHGDTVRVDSTAGASGAGRDDEQCKAMPDTRILGRLAAPKKTHGQLMEKANQVLELLCAEEQKSVVASVELYGSLALGRDAPRKAEQGQPSYVNDNSDIDLVVELHKGVPPDLVVEILLEQGWKTITTTEVHKFDTTQYNFLKTFVEGGEGTEVNLDVTCVASPVHFDRFKKRQEAFRKVFYEVRNRMEQEFGSKGVLAFDAYVHLLKVFAAKKQNNAMTGFQATCVGIFAVQIGYFKLKPTQSFAVNLFEGFLRFCAVFFGDAPQQANQQQPPVNYRHCCMDLTLGGRLFPRSSNRWRSEMYLVSTEEQLGTPRDERVNIAHSLQPSQVSEEARAMLKQVFPPGTDCGASFLPNAPTAPQRS